MADLEKCRSADLKQTTNDDAAPGYTLQLEQAKAWPADESRGRSHRRRPRSMAGRKLGSLQEVLLWSWHEAVCCRLQQLKVSGFQFPTSSIQEAARQASNAVSTKRQNSTHDKSGSVVSGLCAASDDAFATTGNKVENTAWDMKWT